MEAKLQEIVKEKMKRCFPPCFSDNCPLGEHCVRRQASHLVDTYPVVMNVVNLANPDVAKEGCPMYKSDEPVRMAYGFTGLLDQLPLRSGKRLMELLTRAYCRTHAYEMRSGTRPMLPAIQKQVEAWCREMKFEGPVTFDRYDMAYDL